MELPQIYTSAPPQTQDLSNVSPLFIFIEFWQRPAKMCPIRSFSNRFDELFAEFVKFQVDNDHQYEISVSNVLFISDDRETTIDPI